MNNNYLSKIQTLLLLIFILPKATASSKESQSAIFNTLTKYAEAPGVRVKFEKTDIKKALGTKKTMPGEMKYADNKINIVLFGERKTEIIFNGSNLWLIEYPDLDFDPKGKRKVTEVQDHKPVLVQQIVGLFQKPTTFLKTFKIISEKKEGKMRVVGLQSKDKSIQNFAVEFSTVKFLINSIRFTDDVQTETIIEFKETEFLKKAPFGIFKYSPKKDDEVL